MSVGRSYLPLSLVVSGRLLFGIRRLAVTSLAASLFKVVEWRLDNCGEEKCVVSCVDESVALVLCNLPGRLNPIQFIYFLRC